MDSFSCSCQPRWHPSISLSLSLSIYLSIYLSLSLSLSLHWSLSWPRLNINCEPRISGRTILWLLMRWSCQTHRLLFLLLLPRCSLISKPLWIAVAPSFRFPHLDAICSKARYLWPERRTSFFLVEKVVNMHSGQSVCCQIIPITRWCISPFKFEANRGWHVPADDVNKKEQRWLLLLSRNLVKVVQQVALVMQPMLSHAHARIHVEVDSDEEGKGSKELIRLVLQDFLI